MFNPKLIIIFALFTAIAFNANAQKLPADTTVKKQPVKEIFINAGLQYLSSLTYAGRRDPGSVPVLLPTLTFISRHGFFLCGIGYFDLTGSASHAEGFSITPGYVFSFDAKKEYGGAISATKYFITNDSPIILSSFNATIDGQLHFNPNDIAKLTIAGGYRFGKQGQHDIVNDVELSKEIQLIRTSKTTKDGLKITPTITLYSGTQSFTQPNDTTTSALNTILGQPTPQTETQIKRYNLLALSGSIQITYAIKTWQISFTPYLIQPYNSGQNGNYFLFTTGVSATF